MMALGRLIGAYLYFVIISKIKISTAANSEDLVDEYYTTIPEKTSNYLPQDEKDAKIIVDSQLSEKVTAGIITFREKHRRYAINGYISSKIEPVVSYKEGKNWYTIRNWISPTYLPPYYPFWDLCFGLLEDEYVVLGGYLAGFLYRRDETWIIIGMILTKDIPGLIAKYDENHFTSFKEDRKSQRHPFENMLKVWVKHNREEIENVEPNHDNVVKDANDLKSEYESGDWHEKKRDQLELILMKKSIKYARAVITEFEKIMGGKLIEDIINDCVHNETKLNHDLADAYTSLARYVKNKYKYIAGILAQYSNGQDQWSAWFMCIAVVHPNEWPKIDEVFRKDNKEQSLRDFILQKFTSDKIMAEMIAVIIDPTFKPTTFSPTPTDGGK